MSHNNGPVVNSLLAAGLVFIASPLLAQSPRFELTGVEGLLEGNIRAHVQLPDLACDVGGYRLARNLPGIRNDIVRAGRALGYYHISHVTRFEQGEDCWILRSEVEPGQPVRVGRIDINIAGNEDFFRSPLQNLPLASGEQLNQGRYEQIKNDLTSIAVENGFFDARFSRAELNLDLVSNTGDIQLDFEPGSRYRIGAIEIQQLDALAPEFIQRFLDIEEGDFYSSEALLDLRQSLSGSLYFSNVSVTPAITDAQNERVPIQVSLQMRPQRVYSAGVGVTTDIGPRLRLDYEDRYRNRQGHSINGNVGISPIQQNADLIYGIPLRDPATESLQISGGFLSEDTESFRNETTRLATSYRFINAWQWRQNYFVNLQHDEAEIAGSRLQSDLLIGGVNLNRTRADDALYPNSGWRLFGEIKGASEKLLSSSSFLQLNVAGKLIQSLGPGRVLLRFEAGTSLTSEIDELPVSVRYFSGGDQTVRGYKYDSLGPENEAGEVIGGKHKISAGIEYDFHVAPNWKLAVFADTGNAFEDFNEYDLKTGVGIGVRWMSPVGPIRLDLASALDNDNELRLHITMGPDL
ncbi:MAG: autotransporter assembly complex family protein [Pseudohongiellaceae bacterium]